MSFLTPVLSTVRPIDCTATIAQSIWLTPTIKSIRLELDQPNFRFLPGQAIWPNFEQDGRQFSKIYSIASAPVDCTVVELCVSRVGWSSAYLQDLPPGDRITARGPYGLLTLDRVPDRPLVYVAEGSGIAPIKSHIDWLYAQCCTQPIWLIQANPETPDRLPYTDHFQALAQRWPNFYYQAAIAPSPETLLAELAANLHAQGRSLSHMGLFICAVNRRTLDLQQAAIAAGALPSNIKLETFHSF